MAGRRKLKKFRRKFKKFQKKYKKMKKHHRKAVTGRKTFTISKKHLKTKRQLKWTQYTRAAYQPALGWTTLWSNQGNDSTGTRFMTMPANVTQTSDATIVAGGLAVAVAQIQNELDQNGAIGRSFAWKFVDLRIQIRPDPTIWNQIPKAPPVEVWRLLLVQERNQNQSIADITTNYGLFTPILARDWKILYDKVYTMNTGAPAVTTQAAPVNCTTICATPKHLRFKFPMKFLVDWNNYNRGAGAIAWTPPVGTYLMLFNTNGITTIDGIQAYNYFVNM